MKGIVRIERLSARDQKNQIYIERFYKIIVPILSDVVQHLSPISAKSMERGNPDTHQSGEVEQIDQ
jgi:hypothetical protein